MRAIHFADSGDGLNSILCCPRRRHRPRVRRSMTCMPSSEVVPANGRSTCGTGQSSRSSRRLRRVVAARSICSSRRRRTDRRSKAQPQYFPPAGPHDRSCRMDGRSCWDLHPSGGPLGYHQLQGRLVGHVDAPIVKRLVRASRGLARENPGPAVARGSIAWRRIDGQSRPKRQLKHTGAVRLGTKWSSR